MVGGQHSVKKYIEGLGRLRTADLNVPFQGLGYSCGAKCACCKTIICISDSITWICILSTHKKLRAAAGKPSTVGGGGRGAQRVALRKTAVREPAFEPTANISGVWLGLFAKDPHFWVKGDREGHLTLTWVPIPQPQPTIHSSSPISCALEMARGSKWGRMRDRLHLCAQSNGGGASLLCADFVG